jgi:hypothetical protein
MGCRASADHRRACSSGNTSCCLTADRLHGRGRDHLTVAVSGRPNFDWEQEARRARSSGRHTSGLTKTVGSTSPSMAAASVNLASRHRHMTDMHRQFNGLAISEESRITYVFKGA